MKRYLIGLDNGGTSVKAALFDELGNQLCIAQRKLHTLTNSIGYMERDLDELWNANIACLKELVDKHCCDVERISAMSFSGHGKGLYLLDKNGNPLGNGITSMDQRALDIVENWNLKGISDEVSKRTYQKVQYMQPVALLRWIKEHDPARYRNIGTILSVKDFVRYRLSGSLHGEYTDFSGSNLIDFEAKTYSKELLKLFEIEEMYDALPPLVASSDICGYISHDVAVQTGLKEGLPLAAGMFDVDACSIGCGMISPSQMTMIAGTWSINVYIKEQQIKEKDVQFQSFYALPQYTLIEESSATSCGNLEWIMREMLDTMDYNRCNKLVEAISPSIDDVFYLPFLYGCNEGSMNACFANIKSHHTRAHLLRAVYEGVVFAHKRHYERLLAYRREPKYIRIAGGVTNSDVWLQIFADVLQVPLEVVEHEEFGTHGAAICAGVACGIYKDYEQAIQDSVHVKKIIYPNAQYRPIYEEKYAKYLQIVTRMNVRCNHV